MDFRLAVALTLTLALLLVPFGRAAAAEATAMPHHAPVAIGGHCDDMPQPDGDSSEKAVDCMIACAAIAADGAVAIIDAVEAVSAVPEHLPPALFAGISVEAEPPPPRVS